MKKKTLLTTALVLIAGSTVTGFWVSSRLATRHATELAEQRAAWEVERSGLEAALKKANTRPAAALVSPATTPLVAHSGKSPADLITGLAALGKSGGASQARLSRDAIYAFESLIAQGGAALPAIRAFLAKDEDRDFAFALPGQGKGPRSLPDEFVVPPSLRFGLFEVLKRIGGGEAEAMLAEVLTTTGRGIELAWVARCLQQMAPGKYRDAAIAGARELLERPLDSTGSPLDRNDRDSLFGVLSLFSDTSYTSVAQAQLVRADGGIDRAVLKYLDQSLGAQAVAIAERAWADPRITDPAAREPLARLALSHVGSDAAANEFYQRAINDMTLSKDQRRNLIEDLNEDGFRDRKNLGAADLPLIENRISLIEQLAPSAGDPVNAEAFKEAYKDLVNMRVKVTGPPK